MKKFIAIFGVLAFTAGMAFSQNNEAKITQENVNNTEAIITQIGSDNDAEIDKLGWSSWNSGSKASILQIGENNFAYQRNHAENHSWGVLKIEQYGTQNQAWQNATEGTHNGPKATIIQGQDGNASHNNWAMQVSAGNNNELKIFQYGVGDNQAYQHVEGGTRTRLTITQDGEGNHYTLTGKAADALDIVGLPAAGEYTQWSVGSTNHDSTNENQATTYIDGNFNATGQYMFGKGMRSDIEITGDYNMVGIGQFGDFNKADVSIIGNNNVAAISQQ